MTLVADRKSGVLRQTATVILLLGAFLTLLGLGTWQVYRLEWKENLLASIDQRTHSVPADLAEVEERFRMEDDVEYWPVIAKGHFVHSAERHFFTTWKGQSGFNVYTPLILANGSAIFVNRGFVPYDRKDAASRAQGQIEGTVEVTGLARNRLAEKPSFIVPENDLAKNVFYWKDLAAMSATAGLPAGTEVLPFFIDANDTPMPGGLPIGGVTLIDLPNSHLQYAVTWYGLALALLVIVFFRARRKTAGEAVRT